VPENASHDELKPAGPDPAGTQRLQETQVYQALNDSAVGRLRRYALKQGVICIRVKEVPIWRGDLQRP
jgi:hypothetical protein